jgi:hypothetical protein
MAKQVLLDENLPQKLRVLLTGHEVSTTGYRGWAGKTNGALISEAEEAGIDGLLTADQGLNYQQNMRDRAHALVVLSTNRSSVVCASVSRICKAIDAAQPGSFTSNDIGF